jgi:hypothetical protein
VVVFVKDLGQNDVLLGRGTGPNGYIGNMRFRALVREIVQTSHLPPYDGKAKTRVALKILNAVKAINGRFLKKIDNNNSGETMFVEVPFKLAFDKTKQSFRHQLRSVQQPATSTPKPPSDVPIERRDTYNKDFYEEGSMVFADAEPQPSTLSADDPKNPRSPSTHGSFKASDIRLTGDLARIEAVSPSCWATQMLVDSFLAEKYRSLLFGSSTLSDGAELQVSQLARELTPRVVLPISLRQLPYTAQRQPTLLPDSGLLEMMLLAGLL